MEYENKEDFIKKAIEPEVEKYEKTTKVIHAVAVCESLEATETEIDDYVKEYATLHGISEEDALENYLKKDRIIEEIEMTKVYPFLYENNFFKEGEVAE